MFTHPQTARTLIAQHHDELGKDMAGARRAGRLLPRWHVSWTRTILVPAAVPGGRSGRAGRRGSSLVIIISAHRSA